MVEHHLEEYTVSPHNSKCQLQLHNSGEELQEQHNMHFLQGP